MTAAEIIQADDEKFIGVYRFARADHGVPPAHILGVIRVIARHMMIAGQRMTSQHRVGLVGIQLAIRFIHQLIARQHRAAFAGERGVEMRALRADDADAICCAQNECPKNKTRSACADRVDSL